MDINKSNRTITISKAQGEKINISQYPNFCASGSIAGMRKKYYGKNARLLKCGGYVYKVPEHYYMPFSPAYQHNSLKYIGVLAPEIYIGTLIYKYEDLVDSDDIICPVYVTTPKGDFVDIGHMDDPTDIVLKLEAIEQKRQELYEILATLGIPDEVAKSRRYGFDVYTVNALAVIALVNGNQCVKLEKRIENLLEF